MLNLAFGVSIFGVTVTVAAFMLGLGLGSLLGPRWLRSIQHPLRLFAFLEAGIALFSFVLPVILQTTIHFTDYWTQGMAVESWFIIQGLFLVMIMLIPTVAMGLGFPILLHIFRQQQSSVGRLYGFNTLGGALGALLPLWLLPWLGVTVGLSVTASMGLMLAFFAFWLSRRVNTSQHVTANQKQADFSGSIIPWLCYAGMGAAALMLEIGWVRLYGLVFLRTEYVLAIILAVYLMGIGLGSLIVQRMASLNAIQRLLNALPLFVLMFVLLGLWLFPVIAQWMQTKIFLSLSAALWMQGTAIASMTLSVTLALGAWLPLLTRHTMENTGMSMGAQWYGINSMGASMGACLAGFVLLPWVGTTATIVIAGTLLCLLGCYWVSGQVQRWVFGVVSLFLVVLSWNNLAVLPAANKLVTTLPTDTMDVYRYEDAVSITHVVEQSDGQRILLTDLQRMDASSNPAAVQTQMNQARLPLALKPDAQSILFLGLGTGITAAGSLQKHGLNRTAVELSHGAIIAAAEWFAPVNQNISQNMNIVHDDARRFLRRDESHYDIIVGDVFHPDKAGRGALLSTEQFNHVRQRLSHTGIFVQWLALNQFDVTTLQIVLRTFHKVFPESRLYVDGFRLAMVGYSSQPMRLSNTDESSLWQGRYWNNIDKVVTPQGVIESEWYPQIEFKLAKLRYVDGNPLADILDWLLKNRSSLDVTAQQLGIADVKAFESIYASTQLIYRSWLHEIRGQMAQAQRLLRYAYQANPQDPWIRSALADRMLASLSRATQKGFNKRQALLRIMSIDPKNTETIRQLWYLERQQGDIQLAEQYHQRLKALNPMDRKASQEMPDKP